MTTVRIELPPKLIPVFMGEARYRGAYGGRGSGKTRTFAKMAAVRGLMHAQEGRDGIILCAREFQSSLDDSSMSEVKAAIQSEPWLAESYEIGEKYIRTKDHLAGRVDFKFIGLSRNVDSVKSKAQVLLCWIDEAEPVLEDSWQKLTPTVREHASEIWVTWNPERKQSPTHKRFRENPPAGSKIIEMNYTDNPWFPDVLEYERQQDLLNRPDQYDHIWLGGFKTIYEGAYYARQLAQAKAEGRISRVAMEPMMTVRTYHDLAGNSDRADAYAMWVCQFVGREIRVLDHYETVSQPPESHVLWLKEWCQARSIKRVSVRLPHDGANVQIDQSWEGIWTRASSSEVKFDVGVIMNQGKGAAMKRVEAARTHFAKCWFNEATTEAGREALAAYHEKRDANRNVGLGPDHDWSSHSADAFGLMASDYGEAKGDKPKARDYDFRTPKQSAGWAW